MNKQYPFPNISVDDACCRGLHALGHVDISYTCTPNIRPKDCPSSIIHFLKEENIEDVQFFKACWWHPYALCSKYYNYLTQFWAMERMPYKCTQSVVIASGIFEPKNLKAFNDEIGINSVVEKTMSYDKYNFFQGNARFQSDASNEGPASGWFVSVYDPQKNRKIHNLNTQQRKKAIVVFIEIACDLFFGEKYEVHLNLIPQFINRAPLLRSESNTDSLQNLQ